MSGLLVCVTPFVPYAGIDHAGGEYLRRYLAVALDAGWTVRLIAPATPVNRAARPQPGVEVALHGAPSVPRRLLNLVRTGVPATTGTAWLRALPAPARAWLDAADVVDLQWADALWNAPTLRRRRPDAVLVGLAHDLRTQSLSRARRSGRGLPRLEAVLGLGAAARRETATLAACDRVLVFKEADRAVLRADRPDLAVGLAPVAVIAPTALPRPEAASRRVLFVGAMFRPENVEAATWLLDRVAPSVRRRVPEVTFRIAGSRPPDALVARAGSDVEVTGFLDDLADAYRDVACVVVPLVRGAGVKFKTVEAVAAGFPVVSTTVGAEGVAEVLGVAPAYVADGDTDFADAVVAALTAPATAGRPVVVGFEEQVRELLDAWAGLRGERDADGL